MFQVFYNPEAPFNPKGKHLLHRAKGRSEAVQAAEEYAAMYYGENSDVWVTEGRKTIHRIPAGANRASTAAE